MPKSPDQFFKDLSKAMDAAAKASKQTDTHWQQIGEKVAKATSQLDHGFVKALTTFTGFAPLLKSSGLALSDAFLGTRRHVDHIRAQWFETARAFRQAKTSADADAALDRLKQLKTELKASRVLTKEIGDIITSKWAIAAGAFVGQMVIAFRYSHQMQDVLKQANSDYATRARLMNEISQVQAATGNEMADMGKGAAALVNYGYDLRGNFKDTLETMVKMEEGLGVSYDLSAQMAVAVRRIGGDFRAVADSVARIKADTALSADEATRFATQISQAVMMLRPGSGGLVAQTSDYISRMAAALKELTGSGDGFVKMMSDFTTEQGMMGAATLGATPDFLSDPAQAKKVTERFVKYVNQQLAGTSGFQRMATIQLLSEQFNTSADVIVNASEMMKKYNETQQKGTSLNEQWRQQTAEFMKTMSKIGNSLSAIVQQTLIPIIRWFNPLLEKLAQVIQWVADSSAALYIGIGALAVSAVGAIITLKRLTFALWEFAAQAGLVSSLKGAGGVGGLAGGLKGAVMTWLPRIGALLTKILWPIAAIAGAAIGGWMIGGWLDKKMTKAFGGKSLGEQIGEAMSRKDTFQAAVAKLYSGDMTREELLKNATAMSAGGKSAQEIMAYVEENITRLRGLYGGAKANDPAWRAQRVKDTIAMLGDEIHAQRIRTGLARQLTRSTQADRDYDEKMMELWKAIAQNTDLANKLTQRVEQGAINLANREQQMKDEQSGENRMWRQGIDSQSRKNNIPSGVFFFPVPK